MAMARYERDKPKRLAAMAAYAAENPERVAAIKARWSARNPEKCRANSAVTNAVRDGRLDKPKACEGCGAEKRLHGHHEDYAKPLEVRWLCAQCHKDRHREMLEAALVRSALQEMAALAAEMA